MDLRKNAFGDYSIYKNGVNKGYTLKILGMYKIYNRKGDLIGHILKRDDFYISYDGMGNPIERGEFEDLLIKFFQQKKG